MKTGAGVNVCTSNHPAMVEAWLPHTIGRCGRARADGSPSSPSRPPPKNGFVGSRSFRFLGANAASADISSSHPLTASSHHFFHLHISSLLPPRTDSQPVILLLLAFACLHPLSLSHSARKCMLFRARHWAILSPNLMLTVLCRYTIRRI